MERLLGLLLTILIVFVGARFMVRALPGDPLESLIAETGTTLSIAELAHEFGLDEPPLRALGKDFLRWMQGDFGRSLISREPVGPMVLRSFKKTLLLTLCGMGLGVIFSLIPGLLAAARPGGRMDRFCTFFGSMTAALPTPWIGPLLILLFAVVIPLFPLGGHLALPSLTLALVFSGFWMRMIRKRVRESLQHGSARGARARGIPEWKVLLKYGLMPVSGALVAWLGTQFGSWLAGTFVTEIIFDWHGMGSLLVDAVLRRDYPVVEATVFIAATTCLLSTWAGDLAQKWLRRE